MALAASMQLPSGAPQGENPPAPPAPGSGQGGARRLPALPGPGDEGPEDRDQRAEQVLQAAIKAHGGQDAIEGRQTIYVKWKITNFESPEPESGTIVTWFKRPMKIRKETTYPRRKEVRVYDGQRAWVDYGQGPQLLGSLMALMMERGILELDSPLLYQHGSLHYLSTGKDLKGRMAQRLSWREQGYARDILVDVATSRVLVIGEFDTPAGAISRMKMFDDYRPVQGVWVPYRQETYRNDQKFTEMEVLEAKFNLPIEDSLFEYTGKESRATSPAGPPSPTGN